MPYSRWVSIIKQSKFPLKSLYVYTSPKYQYNPIYALAGQVINRLPSSLAKYLFPVGIMIIYDKT